MHYLSHLNIFSSHHNSISSHGNTLIYMHFSNICSLDGNLVHCIYQQYRTHNLPYIFLFHSKHKKIIMSQCHFCDRKLIVKHVTVILLPLGVISCTTVWKNAVTFWYRIFLAPIFILFVSLQHRQLFMLSV